MESNPREPKCKYKLFITLTWIDSQFQSIAKSSSYMIIKMKFFFEVQIDMIFIYGKMR